jgi:hypothetical protein
MTSEIDMKAEAKFVAKYISEIWAAHEQGETHPWESLVSLILAVPSNPAWDAVRAGMAGSDKTTWIAGIEQETHPCHLALQKLYTLSRACSLQLKRHEQKPAENQPSGCIIN